MLALVLDMTQPTAELTPWIDILPPPPPSSGLSLWLIAVLLVITVSVLFLLLRYWYTRPKLHALRQLKRITHDLNPHNTKPLAFAVAEALRVGFGVNQVTQIAALVQQPQARLFCNELRRGCYQATAPSMDELNQWLQQARRLLQQTRLFHGRR